MRVLVVDDNRDAADAIALYLTLTGHEVTTAADGREGLGAARSAPFDAVVTDLNMPHMNGDEMIRELRLLVGYAGIPVVIITGSTLKCCQELCEELSAYGPLAVRQKPCEMPELLRVIAELEGGIGV